jgi:hypothetical protein
MLRATDLRRLMLAGRHRVHPDGIGPRVLVLSNSRPGRARDRSMRARGSAPPELPSALGAAARLSPAKAVANLLDLADAREDRFGIRWPLRWKMAPEFDAIHHSRCPFMVDGGAVVGGSQSCAVVRGRLSSTPHGHPRTQAEWMEAMEAAGVLMFDSAEDTGCRGGLLARFRSVRGLNVERR